MMRVLAVDPSKTASGWAIFDGRECMASGTLRSDGVEDFAQKFTLLVGEWRPKVICFERAIRSIKMYGKKGLLPGNEGFVTPNAASMILHNIEGVIIGVGVALDIRLLGVAVATWRAAILGDGKLSRDVAKRRAKETCQHLKIKYRSVDEAEAILIGLWASSVQEIRYWEKMQ